MDIYVDIGTPPTWDIDRVRHTNLDLGVVRKTNSHVITADEDESARHQQQHEYPPDLIAASRRAADTAATMLRSSTEPFGVAFDRWIGEANASEEE